MHSLPLPLIKSPYVSRNLIPVKEKKKGKESVFPFTSASSFPGFEL